jgi:hypothetical protein
MALFAPVGRALAKTWMNAARSTETSDQRLRPRMIDHFNEPASRATRWALFALRRSIEGTRRGLGLGPPFVLRHIEGNTADHGATAADTKCAQHQPL